MRDERFGGAHYHARHEGWAASSPLRAYLRRSYAWSAKQLAAAGRPLSTTGPLRVLLCGTGSAATTAEFCHFAESVNARAELWVVDVDVRPLLASRRAEPAVRYGKVHWTVADARALPFPDASFDWVETDFLLQFHDFADKAAIVREWARVLAGTGVVTTREWVKDHRRDWAGGVADVLRKLVLRGGLGMKVYSTDRAELEAVFGGAGLTVAVRRPRSGPFKVPLLKAVAAWKAGTT